jgi:hypothetical protein
MADGMVKWREWREWWNGRKNGRMAEWQKWIHRYYLWYTPTLTPTPTPTTTTTTLKSFILQTLEVILEHVLGIKTMTSLIPDHVATACLYLGINTREKVMILFLVIVLDFSQD